MTQPRMVSPRFAGRCCLLSAALLCGLAGGRVFAAGPQEKQPQPAITLFDGSTAPGELKDSETVATIRWQSRSFASPFEFALGSVNAIHYPAPAQPIKPAGELCFELSGGDVLFGSLLTLDGTTAEIDAPPFGRLRVERSRIERMYRWRDRADLVYMGPRGLADWATNAREGWREEAGQILTDQTGALLWGDFKIPPQAEIELAISWKGKPNFLMALGVNEDQTTIDQAFRLDVWNDDLVLARENPRDADVALLQHLVDGKGQLHVRIYLDQNSGHCLVFSQEGERIADVTVPPSLTEPAKAPRGKKAGAQQAADVTGVPPAQPAKQEEKQAGDGNAAGKVKSFAGLRLLNKRGDLRIERLRVGRWNGEPPQNVTPGKSRVHLVDSTVVYGEVVGFEPAQKEFTLRDGDQESKIAADRVATMFLKSTPNVEPGQVRVVHQDGSQVSGELTKIVDGSVHVTAAGIAEPLQLPVKDLRALLVLQRSQADVTSKENPAHRGVLELDGLRLPGRLVDGQEQGASSCLVWHPLHSATASALLKGASGRIVYREPPVAKPTAKNQPAGGAVARAFNMIGGAPARVAVPPNGQAPGGQVPAAAIMAQLHLRSGDTVPCEVTGIDEQGVHFKTPVSDASFAANDKIKAIELIPGVNGPLKLNKGKRDRLLTLPRLQKENPPTHLIRSINGDYLRGSVTSLDEKSLNLEIHLEPRKIPRERVAQIIWLHPDELAPKPQADAPSAQETRVQALRSDGVRMTFIAERFADEVLSGKSEILGATHVNLKDIDQLSIGPAIELHAARLAFQKWKLHNAIEPKVMSSDGEPGGGDHSAANSALVDKPAPDFKLELLSGKKFRLADAKGKIVVLDFFASWCGPCLQTMPQIDKVAKEFADKDVLVVAVNLEEGPQAITSMFERHKLSMPVALDEDGAVSAKYGVTSIPQTIVIDREGKVVRHYIGGSPKLGEEVTAVLQDLLKPAAP
jgi:peroxiredoxin